MSAGPFLSVHDLAKYFPVGRTNLGGRSAGWVKAVDGIDFSINHGRTLALVGESGCGKTTTAHVVLRLEAPTKGRVLIDGQDVQRLKGAALRNYRTCVQAVFQDPWASLNPRMRVRGLVTEPLVVNRRLSRRDVDRRLEKVLADVGLRREHARNYPHEFSGGQRQRIAIASALISEPQLIVLDEPVSALDVSIRSQIMNLLKDIQEEYGVSYLLVAHDLGTTRYLAHEVAVMYLGRIVERAETETLFTGHKHPYTEALFSAALPSHPDARREEIILRGEVPSPMNVPTGCPFHTRCQVKLGKRCEEEVPDLRAVDANIPRHVAACHRLD